MKKLEYQIKRSLPEEAYKLRFEGFNEKHGKLYEASSVEEFDLHAFHLQFFCDSEFAGATRLTEYPNNFMSKNLLTDTTLQFDRYTLEMGRTFVQPKFRGMKLLNIILLIGLDLAQQMGYRKVIGTESKEVQLKMPTSIGFEYTGQIIDLKFPGDFDGVMANELVILCDLSATAQLRKEKIFESKNWFVEKGYELIIPNAL